MVLHGRPGAAAMLLVALLIVVALNLACMAWLRLVGPRGPLERLLRRLAGALSGPSASPVR